MTVAKERYVVVSEVSEPALCAAGLLRFGLLRARLLRRGLLARRAVAILATAEHLHFVGADLGGVLVLAVLVLPFARAQAAFDIDLADIAQILAGDLGELSVEAEAVPLGRLLALGGRSGQ